MTLQQKHFQFFINLKLYFNKEQFSNDAVPSKEFACKNHFSYVHYFPKFLFYNHGQNILEKLKISCKIPHYTKNSKPSF